MRREVICCEVVRLSGLEPERPFEPRDFKSRAYADSATAAWGGRVAETARDGKLSEESKSSHSVTRFGNLVWNLASVAVWQDFKFLASANFATPAWGRILS